MEIEKETKIEPCIFWTWLVSAAVGFVLVFLSGCTSTKTATLKETRDTTLSSITDRSFSVKDSFYLKFDSLGFKEFGFINAPIARLSGNQIDYDTMKMTYDFKNNIIKAEYKTKPDSIFKETITRDKTETIILPRPWSEILTYVLIGLAISSLVTGLIYLLYGRK